MVDYLLIVVFAIAHTESAIAGYNGTEFYFTIPVNAYVQRKDNCSRIVADVTSKTAGNLQKVIHLSPNELIEKNITVNKGLTSFEIPCRIIRPGSFGAQQGGVYIRTDVSVTIYVTTFYQTTVTPVYVPPLEDLGTLYLVTAYQPVLPASINFLSLLGASDNTSISVNTSSNTNNMESKVVTLNRLQMIQWTDLNITKAEIYSNKPIAVYAGLTCAVKCDVVVVGQMVPAEQFSKRYIMLFAPNKMSYTPSVSSALNIACKYNKSDGSCINTSNKQVGEFVLENNILAIDSIKAAGASQYAVISTKGTISVYTTNIPAVDRFMVEYEFVVPDSKPYGYTNLVAVVVPKQNKDYLLLDGVPVSWNQTYAVPIPLDAYSVVVAFVSPGYHTLKSRDGSSFGLMVYGFNNMTGYGYPAGLLSIENKAEIVIVTVNGALMLDCGNPGVATYSWEKKNACYNQHLPFNDTFFVFKGSAYTVSNVNFGDLGDYKCTASDGVRAVIHEYHVEFSESSYGFKDRCTFDKNTTCGWIQTGVGKWTFQKGSLNLHTTGPADDHTLHNGQGIYMFTKESDPSRVENATFLSRSLPAGMDLCLSFWYYMYSIGGTSLTVQMFDPCTGKLTELFSALGDKGKQWLEAKITIRKDDIPNDYHLLVHAEHDRHGDSTVAIDDLQTSQQACSGQGPTLVG